MFSYLIRNFKHNKTKERKKQQEQLATRELEERKEVEKSGISKTTHNFKYLLLAF